MWSQIQDTELATEAFVLMNENEISGCEYHNNRHIEAMYQYLEDTNVPYDEALDWAIMFHDVVYDAEPYKEIRSAQAFMQMAEDFRGCNLDLAEKQRVCDLILATAGHKVLSEDVLPGNKAIIRADLHALTDKAQTINNFVKIMNESITLYDCSIQDFAEKNILFMEDLKEQMMLNMLIVETNEVDFYDKVIDGINTTIKLAQAIRMHNEIL